MVLAEETTEFGASQDHVEPADKDGIEGSRVDTEVHQNWYHLSYLTALMRFPIQLPRPYL